MVVVHMKEEDLEDLQEVIEHIIELANMRQVVIL